MSGLHKFPGSATAGKHSHVVDEATEAQKVKRQGYNVDDGRSTYFRILCLMNMICYLERRCRQISTFCMSHKFN